METTTVDVLSLIQICGLIGLVLYFCLRIERIVREQDTSKWKLGQDKCEWQDLQRDLARMKPLDPPVPRRHVCEYCDTCLPRYSGRTCKRCGAPNPIHEQEQEFRQAHAFGGTTGTTGKLRDSIRVSLSFPSAHRSDAS